MNTLDGHYYRNSDHSPDKYAGYLQQDCIDVNSYMILKNMYPDKKDIFDLFMSEFTFSILLYDDEKSIRIFNEGSTFLDSGVVVFKESTYENLGENAVAVLETCLQENNYVMVTTVIAFFPYYPENPQFKLEEFSPGHIITFIKSDAENFYVVDSMVYNHPTIKPDFINYDIVKIPKKDIALPLGYYMRCTTIKIDEERYNELFDINLKLLKRSLKSYLKPISNQNGGVKYMGRSALLKLIEISSKKSIELDYISKTNGSNSFSFIWSIKSVVAQRQIMLKFFRSDGFESNFVEEISALISEDIRCWDMIWGVFEKNYNKKYYTIDSRYTAHFQRLLVIEDQIFELLKKI